MSETWLRDRIRRLETVEQDDKRRIEALEARVAELEGLVSELVRVSGLSYLREQASRARARARDTVDVSEANPLTGYESRAPVAEAGAGPAPRSPESDTP